MHHRLQQWVIMLFLLAGASSASHAANPPSSQQALQGLLTGNKVQDRALAEAFQRGYQRGGEDARTQCEITTRQLSKHLAQLKAQCAANSGSGTLPR